MASSLLSSLITQPSPSIFVKIQRSRSLKQLRCFPNKSHFAHSSSSPLSHPPPSPRFSAAASLCTYRFFSQSPSLRHFAARAVAVAASEAPQSDGAGASLCAYRSFSSHLAHSLLIQSNQLEVGKMVMNVNWSKPSTSGFLPPAQNAKGGVEVGNQLDATRYEIPDLNSPIGNCMPLAYIRMGTLVHCIECNPGQGAKLVRAAGTFAKVMKVQAPQCLVQLPSGVEKLIDYRCRATIGVVSNSSHSTRKLRKAGRSRWLGRRPVVRGVAMNPVDHPHGGGEGRTKGGRPSVSPWGKPTKAGFRTGVKKHKK